MPAGLVLALLMMAAPAPAEGYAFPIDVRAQPLDTGLQELARETGIELLFDRDLVRGLQCPHLRERLSLEAALRHLLSGSGLVARRASSGAWLIERPGGAQASAPDVPIPDILVIGSRSGNVDIPRRENDIQPYRVSTGTQIVSAHRDNIDQYFASRVNGNTQAGPLSLAGTGQTNSAIDLRGLGTDGTLVLIDGRRMPGIPLPPPPTALLDGPPRLELMQPDLNAIPLHAIERIETLTGTAGGIYGFGALGGVVNIVLRHEYRGVELHATTGLSARGGATRYAIEGRVGFTPDHGDTDVMLYVSHSRTRPLLQGQRDLAVRNYSQAVSVAGSTVLASPFQENGIGVFDLSYDIFGTANASPLVLKAEYGGAGLGSSFTFLPHGFNGTSAQLVPALVQRAGRYDLSLTGDQAADEIGAHANMASAHIDVRHRFGAGLEAYAQALILRDSGESVTKSDSGSTFLGADDPANPFDNDLYLTFPLPRITRDMKAAYASQRYTAGVIAALPAEWRGTAEATLSVARSQSIMTYKGYDLLTHFADLNPLGSWDTLQRAIANYPYDQAISSRSSNRVREQSLRLAGPVFTTGGGPATLTLLAERRQEHVPAFTANLSTSDGLDEDTVVGARRSATTSFYAEFRTRVYGDSAPLPILRNFELQFAARHDRQTLDAASTAPGFFPTDANETHPVHFAFTGTAYTVGAKLFPMPWLMLRGSYATGEQPPALSSLFPVEGEIFAVFAADPKRGGAYIINIDDLLYKTGGSPDLKEAKASTFSLGLVMNPFANRGPRFSFDYSRIRKTDDVYVPTDQQVIDHETDWPQRVVRAALTDDDRALGYTGGVVTEFDSRATNGASVIAESLDSRIDWTVPLFGGKLHTYAGATLQLRNERDTPFNPPLDRVGYRDGPVKWRANGGADWTAGSLTIGANLQYFDQYRVYNADMANSTDALLSAYKALYIQYQGSPWVPAQAYLDFYVSKRFRTAGGHEFSLDLGIVNLLDASPPRETDLSLYSASYSRYGDPRQRRLELTVSAGF